MCPPSEQDCSSRCPVFVRAINITRRCRWPISAAGGASSRISIPKDDSPVCTTGANQCAALAHEFACHDAAVIGASKDSCASHHALVDNCVLRLGLLADNSRAPRAPWRVTGIGIERSEEVGHRALRLHRRQEPRFAGSPIRGRSRRAHPRRARPGAAVLAGCRAFSAPIVRWQDRGGAGVDGRCCGETVSMPICGLAPSRSVRALFRRCHRPCRSGLQSQGNRRVTDCTGKGRTRWFALSLRTFRAGRRPRCCMVLNTVMSSARHSIIFVYADRQLIDKIRQQAIVRVMSSAIRRTREKILAPRRAKLLCPISRSREVCL